MAALPQRNVARAQRIASLIDKYRTIVKMPVTDAQGESDIASIMTDMRHWCDYREFDFTAAVHASSDMHQQEQGEDGE